MRVKWYEERTPEVERLALTVWRKVPVVSVVRWIDLWRVFGVMVAAPHGDSKAPVAARSAGGQRLKVVLVPYRPGDDWALIWVGGGKTPNAEVLVRPKAEIGEGSDWDEDEEEDFDEG